jgi:hypothetical protein
LPDNLETLYTGEAKAELKRLRDELARIENSPPELPSAMGATEDRVADEPIHLRGDPLKVGAIVPRHVPPAIRGPASPEFTTSQSGRRELAEWLVDPAHPLTARVLVNRVWRWHFGAGLVRSTDNFGLLGEKPTHPELLDWLATRFVADGWSLKALHRQILSSSTYQQSSSVSTGALARDAENRLWSRFAVRRLEAEAVRDSLLAVSGQLDRSLGGSLLTVKNRGYFFDHTSKDLTNYDSQRRSVYLPVVRNNVYDIFQLLDFPDPAIPTGDRATTTIAPQALLMLNSELVLTSADRLASRLQEEFPADSQRCEQLYLLAYGRPPTANEIEASAEFVAAMERALADSQSDPENCRQQAWSALCQTILAANEFIYLP